MLTIKDFSSFNQKIILFPVYPYLTHTYKIFAEGV